MSEITLPFNFDIGDCEYLLPFLAAEQRFKIAVIHRRGRKTRMALSEQIKKTQVKKGVYYYVLPTYKQAKQVIFDELLHEHLPMEIVDKKNDSELAVYYKNGSVQRFVGSEDPDKHRGVNAIDFVFDEFSEQDPKMWTEIAQPILRENGGTATWCFTPKGKNHAWKLMEYAKQHPEDWFVTCLPANKTNVFTSEELEGIRSSGEIPEVIFRQEYLCEFVDGATAVFRRVQENIYKGTEDGINPSRTYQLGVDLAKYVDFTVITPFDLNKFRVLPQERFNQVDWNLQKARIEASWLRHGRCKVVIDGTGVGDPVVEDLTNHGISVEPFKFTEQSRKDLLVHLSILFEQDKIKIPDDPELIDELSNFQWVMSDGGKLKIASVGAHDDRVMSLALAVWGCPNNPLPMEYAMSVEERFDKWDIV